MNTRQLAYGVYDATPNFQSIPQHSCVCFADDMGLVATTGPAGDKESEEYAELFAKAPIVALAAREMLDAIISAARVVTLPATILNAALTLDAALNATLEPAPTE
jgi:hypothetical protein